ncbi:phenol 2-monooxygenase [Sulfitobacter alexandrii]|uniref:Phenol 2-monooxygenase n=1 Tax=Sulfitobacter alexandrii TaxID=1917485 RepID=A0A1J0WJJ1_9RHOB|nr:FAD-dependent monooxygenase [Sulfitobacter alexandrii]APE44489.1 phenol 2-monooxygenase [Sulfitobacter alexandrii]
MQYHLNGYRTGDPAISPAVDRPAARDAVDVLIVGCGPAGLTLAAQLSCFADITTRIVDRKAGPLEVGQADGIACRSMEMFEAFGFAEKVAKEAYWVNEVAFWRPDAGTGQIARADRILDTEEGLSEFPHVILNQARVHDFYLEHMRNGPARLSPDYNLALVSLTRTTDADHPVEAVFDRLDAPGTQETVRARFVIGCDGARSTVRAQMGHRLKGEAARQLWGVMDILAVTDFPDIRLKCAIQSADQGSLLIIPREGGYMVRMYIELDSLRGDERPADRNLTADALVAKARAILSPHRLEVREVAWWSAYEIGQRVCDGFDDVPDGARGARVPRIFIAGDACHTHSPKAGQGMNVSMADAFNLGWKLAAVLRGQAHPALLDSYSNERRAKAQELIDFDRDMARLFSEKPKSAAEAARFQAYFRKHGRYTAGVETRYAPSALTADDTHQGLAPGLPIGMRFHSAPVIRLADARPMELAHVAKADGRWRLFTFAGRGDDGARGSATARLCEALSNLIEPAAPDALLDLRAVFQQPHRDLGIERMPPLLLPRKGRYGLIDYEKIFAADPRDGRNIYTLRQIDRENGAMVLVRPDQHVAALLPFGDMPALRAFLDRSPLILPRRA